MESEIWDIKVYATGAASVILEEALEEVADAVLLTLIERGPHKDHWEIQAIFNGKPDEARLKKIVADAAKAAGVRSPKYTLSQMQSKNWLKESLKSFEPVVIGSFYIYGSHVKPRPPAGKIPLEIDAATAFGSGEHQTTQGCLAALSDLTEPGTSLLDMGCGSGILAMAYAKMFNRPADAVDNDPESVSVTTENVRKNALSDLIDIWHSDAYETVTEQYDLIMANILANPLIEMARDLAAHLNPGGTAILSGFLYDQETDVLNAHTAAGLKFVKKYRIKGWSTLVVKKD